jgi:hypothetical protein
MGPMASLQGYLLAANQTTDVICAYASGEKTLPAYTTAHWRKIGSFTVPEQVSARLVVQGSAAFETSLVVKLLGPAEVTNSEAIISLPHENKVTSGVMNLQPGVMYVVAAMAIAAAEDDQHFGSITAVSLGAP